MINSELLQLLRCPETQQKLQLAEPALLRQLNDQIAAGTLKNSGGRLVKEPLEAGLLRADGQRLYPIRGDIPVMLVDEAIAVK